MHVVVARLTALASRLGRRADRARVGPDASYAAYARWTSREHLAKRAARLAIRFRYLVGSGAIVLLSACSTAQPPLPTRYDGAVAYRFIETPLGRAPGPVVVERDFFLTDEKPCSEEAHERMLAYLHAYHPEYFAVSVEEMMR